MGWRSGGVLFSPIRASGSGALGEGVGQGCVAPGAGLELLGGS